MSNKAPVRLADNNDTSVRLVGAAAGVASGVAKLVVGQPFDIIKIRMQCSAPGTYKGPLDVLLRTVKKEGLRAVYKGGSPQLLGWMMSDAVLLGSLHNYRLLFARIEARSRGLDPALGQGKDERLSLKSHAAAGAMAGWTCSLVMTPMEHLKAKLQMQTTGPKQYTGPIDAARQVAAASKFGYVGLWHGLGATMLFRTWIGGLFWFYEVQLRAFRSLPDSSPWKPSPGAATFIAGGFGSTFFWLLSLPFDAVKNRLMADSPTHPRYPTWRSAARQIYSEGGPRAFYRGFIPGMLRSFPTNASALLCWETTMRLLGAEQLKQ